MADGTNASVTISYTITGIDTSTRKIRNFDSANKQMATTTRQSSNAMSGLATRFVGLQAIMTGVISSGRKVIAWVNQSVEEFRKYEKSLAEVQTILGELSSRNMPVMASGIENLSVKFGKSAKDLSEGMYDILSAAFEASDAMELLNTAAEASVAGLTSVSTSVDVFTSILNAWGLSVAQAGQISDELFQTVVRGKLIFGDLASAMGYIAPIAANLGVEFKEVAAALSTVTRQGQHVDMATRGLALGLQNIADLSPKAATAARKYGVDLSAVALQVGGLEYIIKQLNTATSEFGSKILPEMISNMRSLRVFMALAGDEGIAGFTTDLNLLEAAAGKTEEAMNRMMRTQQYQADVLGQQMKMLERDIGEAWSGFEIGWKKAQLWWGTFLSGGDADAAIDKFETRVAEVYSRAAEVLRAQSKAGSAISFASIFKDFDISKFETFQDAADALKNVIGESINFEGAKKYLSLKKERNDVALFISGLIDLQSAMSGAQADFKLGIKSTSQINSEVMEQLMKTMYPYTFDESIEKTQKLIDLSNEFSDAFVRGSVIRVESLGREEESLAGYLEYWSTMLRKGPLWAELSTQQAGLGFVDDIEKIGGIIDSYTLEVDSLTDRMNIWSNVNEEVLATIDNLDDTINQSKENIIELDNAIRELEHNVETLYTAAGGQEFIGVDSWTVALSAAASQLDRFTNYAAMSIKYGDDMNMSFMDGVSSIEGYQEIFGEIPDYMNEVNMSIWETVKANNALDESFTMEDLISGMSDYVTAQKLLEEQTKATKKEMDALSLAMKYNSLEISKIELKGMMRRRGLTRSEEKKIKQLKINNAELSIQITERELTEEEARLAENVETTADAYDEMKEIYDEYVARVKLDIWELNDTRDADLINMLENITYQKNLLVTYRDFREGEYLKLEASTIQFIAMLGKMAEDEDLAADYRALYGIDALELAQQRAESYVEFVNNNLGSNIEIDWKTSAPSTNDIISGGATKTQGQLEYEASGMTSSEWASATQGQSGVYSPAELLDGGQNINSTRSSSGTTSASGSRALSRGSYYIPETQPYLLHRGEQVIPSGKDAGGGDVYINIVNNNDISTAFDIEEFAARQAQAIAQRLSNSRSGKSNYRMR